MKEVSTQEVQPENICGKTKKWIWIIISVSAVVIIGVVILVVLLVRKKNDDDDEKEEQNPEPTTENTQEEISEYDQLCLLLQLSSFAGKEANSFSPRAEPNETLREDGVFVKTDINFGNTFPNSYLDIYYPGPIEEDRPTYIYWH